MVKMKNLIIQKKPNQNALLHTLHDRCHKYNNDSRIAFIGETGGSKSWSALTTALTLDPTFTPDRIVFTANQFSDYIKNHNLQRGQAIIFDEAGIKYSNRKWWTEQNIMINELLQTLRYRGLILIFTAPTITDIDCGGRAKFHVYFEAHHLDLPKRLGVFKPFIISYNARSGKRYEKYPIYYRKWATNGVPRRRTTKMIAFKAPPNHLIKDYEAAAEKFKDKVGTTLQQKQEQNKVKDVDIIAEILKNPKQYKYKSKGKNALFWSTFRIAEDFNLSINKAKLIKQGLPSA